MRESSDTRTRETTRTMLADAQLPDGICPSAPASADPPRTILLTGACGFLGRRVAREWLRQADVRVLCLARAKGDATAGARVADALAQVGVEANTIRQRIEVFEGDVGEPNLGLDAAAYAELVNRIELIVHCAAVLDWVRSYRQLYRTNVGGVLEIVRLAASGRAKRVVFASSIAVCYAHDGPPQVNESTNMLAHVGDMPLGYAQSKCVAEELLRQASARGVPVTLVRPALISGDSVSGEPNPEDFLAALIQACARTGMAMDADWHVDCVPVDFVARVIACVSQGDNPLLMLHLVHERPRHWRELVLWMNLHGYPMQLVERAAWVRHLFEERHAHGLLVYPQRRFFCGTQASHGGAAPFETYLGGNQRRIGDAMTRATLARFGFAAPPLNAELLHRYFRRYRAHGLLQPVAADIFNDDPLPQILETIWGRAFGEASALPCGSTLDPIASDNAILGDIASARPGRQAGLWKVRYPARGDAQARAPQTSVLKVKAPDTLIRDLTAQLAALCRPELGALLKRFPQALGLTGSHERELVFYETAEPGLRPFLPTCYATHRGKERWALLLEHLPEAAAFGPEVANLLGENGLYATLDDLGKIHAVWYRRETELARLPWLAPRLDTSDMLEAMPLWRALSAFAANWFFDWCGTDIRNIQRRALDTLPTWWPRLQTMPATLIHNDFNPRNFIIRADGPSTRLCVFDWELATVGLPQHDLAELLCFSWQNERKGVSLTALLEMHRLSLATESGTPIDKDQWREGFALALRHLLINRLPLYTLIHRFRPLAYLPCVMRNWMVLHELSVDWVSPESVRLDQPPPCDC